MPDPFELDDDIPFDQPGAPAAAAAPWLDGLNPEQRQAVETTEGPVLVLSGAGTGKTRVLTTRLAHILLSGKARPWECLAVTFTNKAAREMRERVAAMIGPVAENVWLGTFHALGVRFLRRHAELVGLTSNFTILDTDDQIRLLKQVMEAEAVDAKKWPAQALMGIVQRWKDKGLTPARVGGGDDAGDFAGGRAAQLYAAYQERLKTLNACDFGDLLLHCLTVFQQHADIADDYRRRFRYILVDEYQDTNVAQYLWLRLLAGGHRNICCVGDDDQCVAAGTMVRMGDGGLRRVEDVKAGDLVLSSYGSGDFRPARVGRVHRRRFSGEMVQIRTAAGHELLTTPEHVHFADVVLHESPQKHFTYLMMKRGYGYRLGTSQIYTRGQRHAVVGYQQRCLQEHADAVWLVHAFETEQDARAMEHRLSLLYGITTLPFVARRGAAANGLVNDQERLDALHRELAATARVVELMDAHGLSPEHPHFVPQAAPGRRRNLIMTMNADRRGTTPMHRIAISGNDAEGAAALAEVGLKARAYRRNPANWRYETAFRDFGRIEEIKTRIATRFDLTVVRKANVLGTPLTMRPASQVVPGMVVALADGRHDVVTEAERVPYRGTVHDLDVDGTHNFVANGIVTHNSIYSWRGAEVGNILKFERDFPGAVVVRLERNYRSTPQILAAASGLIANNADRLGKTLRPGRTDLDGDRIAVRGVWDGEEEARVVVDEIEALQRAGHSLAEMAVLVRAGFQSREFEERLLTCGVPYRVLGGQRFYERLEIRDAIAYFRVVLSPSDDLAFERIVNTPKRGLGDATLQVLHRLRQAREIPLLQAAAAVIETDEIKPKARATLRGLMADLARWRGLLDAMPASELAATILEESGYTEMWQRDKTPEAQGRLENLKELVGSLDDYDGLAGFIEHVSLVMDNDDRAEGDKVTLMTLHAAKGLEFDCVFLPGWEEGVFPHQRALDESGASGLEEERRLAYVGITRARRRVMITYAANRRVYNQWQSNLPSRFVAELPEAHVERSADQGLLGNRTGGFAEPWGGWNQRGESRWKTVEASSYRVEPRQAQAGGFGVGDRVFHQKFGNGTVIAADGNKLEIAFDKAGHKKVMDSFVTAA